RTSPRALKHRLTRGEPRRVWAGSPRGGRWLRRAGQRLGLGQPGSQRAVDVTLVHVAVGPRGLQRVPNHSPAPAVAVVVVAQRPLLLDMKKTLARFARGRRAIRIVRVMGVTSLNVRLATPARWTISRSC